MSSQLGDPYRADLVRIVHGDANPAGPGLKFEEVAAPFAGTYPSRFQPVHAGSCAIVTAEKPLTVLDPCTIVVRVQPWLPDSRRQCVLAIDRRLTLWVTATGAGLSLGDAELRLAATMLKRRWYELRIIFEAGRVRLRQTALQRSWGVVDSAEVELTGALGPAGAILFGAAPAAAPGRYYNSYCGFLNGGIEDPAILAGVHDAAGAMGAGRGGLPRVVGLQSGYPERAHPRSRTAGAARQTEQPADAGSLRLAVDRRRDLLAASAPALCRHPLP